MIDDEPTSVREPNLDGGVNTAGEQTAEEPASAVAEEYLWDTTENTEAMEFLQALTLFGARLKETSDLLKQVNDKQGRPELIEAAGLIDQVIRLAETGGEAVDASDEGDSDADV